MNNTTTIKKRAVVTGGAGFIGSNLCEHLVKEGYDVVAYDNLSAGKRENVPEGVPLIEADIRDRAALAEAFKDVSIVFHLAANPRVQDSIDDPLPVFDVNINGTLAVLTEASLAGVGRLVFASSAAVYGEQATMPLSEDMKVEPMSPYGLNKYEGEHWCRLWSLFYGLPTVSLRFFNVYGPRFDPRGAYPLVVGYFLERRREGKSLTVAGEGTNTRDYVHVHDLCRALEAAGAGEGIGHGEVINIGGGKETSVQEIAELVGGPVEHVAPRIEPTRSVAANARAKALLGWEPTIAFEEGVADLKRAYLGE